MRINFARGKSIKRFGALALVAFSFFQLATGAQSSGQSNETIVTGETALVGLASGDMLRFTAFNPAKTESGRPNEPISLRLKLYDARGDVIAESPQIEIPPGEFRSVDFNQDQLGGASAPGERNQVRTTALWGVRLGSRFLVSTSLELVESNTGTSHLWFLNVEALP
jgi:hypothetical protein